MNELRQIKERFRMRKQQTEYQHRKKIEYIYEKIPLLKEYRNQINYLGTAVLLGELSREYFEQQTALLENKINNLLQQNHLPLDFFEVKYHCPNCQDKGFINGKMCVCFQQELVKQYYEQSNILSHLQEENFSFFNPSLYTSGKQDKGKDPRKNILDNKKKCDLFVNQFPCGQNMIFYGKPGTGKTFFTYCVAKELLDKGYTVIYLTAQQLADKFREAALNQEDSIHQQKLLSSCHLLIIDDLGTERQTEFTINSLYNLLNERILLKRSVIISTNLFHGEIQQRYNNRISSRLMGNYDWLKFIGEDIRLIKKFKNN